MPATGALRRLDVEAGLAIAHPAPGLLFAGLARDHLYPVRYHEGAVETNAKLADEVRIPLGIAGELGEKVFCARAGDGAQVRDQILLIHADAGVGHRECLFLLVELQVNARIERKNLVRIIDQRQVAQLVERV